MRLLALLLLAMVLVPVTAHAHLTAEQESALDDLLEALTALLALLEQEQAHAPWQPIITKPANGTTFSYGDSFSISGTAAPDTTITLNINHADHVDSLVQLDATTGFWEHFMHRPSPGTYVITAVASNEGGVSEPANITLTVLPGPDECPEGQTMFAGACLQWGNSTQLPRSYDPWGFEINPEMIRVYVTEYRPAYDAGEYVGVIVQADPVQPELIVTDPVGNLTDVDQHISLYIWDADSESNEIVYMLRCYVGTDSCTVTPHDIANYAPELLSVFVAEDGTIIVYGIFGIPGHAVEGYYQAMAVHEYGGAVVSKASFDFYVGEGTRPDETVKLVYEEEDLTLSVVADHDLDMNIGRTVFAYVDGIMSPDSVHYMVEFHGPHGASSLGAAASCHLAADLECHTQDGFVEPYFYDFFDNDGDIRMAVHFKIPPEAAGNSFVVYASGDWGGQKRYLASDTFSVSGWPETDDVVSDPS